MDDQGGAEVLGQGLKVVNDPHRGACHPGHPTLGRVACGRTRGGGPLEPRSWSGSGSGRYTQVQDKDITRSIFRRFGGTLALDCFVIEGGEIAMGDAVQLTH